MTLNLRTPPFLTLSQPCKLHNNSIFLLLLRKNNLTTKLLASRSKTRTDVVNEGNDDKLLVLDENVISKASSLKDAREVVELIADNTEGDGGERVVSSGDCCRIISAAFLCNNIELVLSVFHAMLSSPFQQVSKENGGFAESWKWSRPDLNTYTTLVIGLAASLRVSDALKMVENICRVGISSSEEVPFGKIIKCPTCLIAVAVAQPQQGIQVCLSR